MSDETQVPAQTLEALLAAEYPNLRRAQRAQAQATALAQEASGSQDVAFSIQENPRTGVYRLRAVPTAGAARPKAQDSDPKPETRDPNSAPVRLKATATTTTATATGTAQAKGGTKTGAVTGKKS